MTKDIVKGMSDEELNALLAESFNGYADKRILSTCGSETTPPHPVTVWLRRDFVDDMGGGWFMDGDKIVTGYFPPHYCTYRVTHDALFAAIREKGLEVEFAEELFRLVLGFYPMRQDLFDLVAAAPRLIAEAAAMAVKDIR